jgi:hypothetical protein
VILSGEGDRRAIGDHSESHRIRETVSLDTRKSPARAEKIHTGGVAAAQEV